MFTIGDFASHGRVSVRMLRHYDAIGLLRPAVVDPATGYRAELQERIAVDAGRLAQVEARLELIEREDAMPADEIQIKRVLAVRVAELSGIAAGVEPAGTT